MRKMLARLVLLGLAVGARAYPTATVAPTACPDTLHYASPRHCCDVLSPADLKAISKDYYEYPYEER